MPSFYRINLGVLADFMDIPNITFSSFSAFFHEYIHFFQDVTTMYGIMALGTTTYYIRDVTSRLTNRKCTFDVLQCLSKGEADYGLLNANLRNIYKGSQIIPIRKDVYFRYEIKSELIEKQTVERVLVTSHDNLSGEEFSFYFGGSILCEGINH